MTDKTRVDLVARMMTAKHNVEADIRATEQQLSYAAKRLARCADDIQRVLDGQRGSLNELGEVQGLGTEVDRLIARRAAEREELRRILWVLEWDDEQCPTCGTKESCRCGS